MSSFSSKCKWLIGAALTLTVLLALAFVVRQSNELLGGNLTTKESAYLRKWSRSAWESKPDFDVEYASIVAARATAAKAQAILDSKNKKNKKASSSGLGLGLGALEALQEDFHPIDDLLSLIKAARGKHRGKNSPNDADRQHGSGSGENALLCASFPETTAPDLQRLLKNMKVMSHQCHWAVVTYRSGYVEAPPANSSDTTAGESKHGTSTSVLLKDFRQSVAELGVRMVLLEEVESQYTLLKRYASRTNPRGTDGQAAAGGDGTDALGRDALQHLSPAIYSQYIKHANPLTVADRTGLFEAAAASSADRAVGGKAGDSSASMSVGPHLSDLANKTAFGHMRGAAAAATDVLDVWDAEKTEGDILRPERGDIPHYNNRASPRPFHWTYLLPVLANYKRVWMLDSGVSLEGFHADKFFRIIECAFEEPPIIAHPLIAGDGHGHGHGSASAHVSSMSPLSLSSYRYLHESYWHQERTAGTADAAAMSFVSMQAPLLDAKFMHWYITRLVLPMLAPAHYLGADAGFEGLLCSAAAMFKSLTKPRAAEGAAQGGVSVSGSGSGSVAEPKAARVGVGIDSSVERVGGGGATINKSRSRYLLQKDSLSPVCIVTVGADPVKSTRIHERDADSGTGTGTGAGAGAGVSSRERERSGKRLREHLSQEMLAMLRDVVPNLYSSGNGRDNDPKANGYASARLDAVLSKNRQCK
jgi:hypothetical protein